MVHLLVIEDERPLLEEIVDWLRFEGFEVSRAENGLIGLQRARENMPDLIISDIMMPQLNGYEVLEELRGDLMTAGIPFIFLTAKSERADLRKGMGLGADDYLTKPFDRGELLTAIRTTLVKHSQQETVRLRVFARLLVESQERERRQIAQRLQSNIAQTLLNLKRALSISGGLPAEAIPAALESAQHLVDQALNQLNQTTTDLWPDVLEHLSLLPALSWYFQIFTAQTRIKVLFEHHGLETTLRLERKVAMYRIIQEALSNAANYAKVNEVSIRIWIENAMVHIEIRDNGVGFDLDAVLNAQTAAGITRMREYAYALSGELTLVSVPNDGTTLIAHLPVESDQQVTKTDLPYGSFEAEKLRSGALSNAMTSDLSPKSTSFDSYSILTEREREILRLVAEGYTNAEIADMLVISPRTAETHRANMMRKLGFHTRADLIRYAIKRGIISVEDN